MKEKRVRMMNVVSSTRPMYRNPFIHRFPLASSTMTRIGSLGAGPALGSGMPEGAEGGGLLDDGKVWDCAVDADALAGLDGEGEEIAIPDRGCADCAAVLDDEGVEILVLGVTG